MLIRTAQRQESINEIVSDTELGKLAIKEECHAGRRVGLPGQERWDLVYQQSGLKVMVNSFP